MLRKNKIFGDIMEIKENINIEFKNGVKTSSSRRYLKKIKEVLS